MKTWHSFCLLLMLFTGRAFSQTINDSITLYASVTAIAQINGSSYGYDSYNIGRRTVSNQVYISRSYYNFNSNLSQIPDNATITQVTVVYYTGGSGYSFKLTKLTSVSGNQQADWAAIGNGSALHTGVPYGASSFTSTSIKTEIQNALGSNVLLIGALSESEGTNGSNSSLGFQLNVEYSYPAPEVDVTVRNDLNGGSGGNVGAAIYPTAATSHNSPYSFTAHVQDRLNLAAYDNQNVNNKVWFFNDTEYQDERSDWKKYDGEFSHLSYSASFTTDQLTEDDDDASFNAYLKTTSYTTSGTMSSNETWFTSPVTVTDNLTIASGVTLTVKPGVTVQAASGKKITVNGALAASGSYSSRITFRAASGTWYGIEVNNGASFHPSFCNFENVQTAIRYYHAYGDVHSCNFTDYSTALRYENSSTGRIDYSSLVEYPGQPGPSTARNTPTRRAAPTTPSRTITTVSKSTTPPPQPRGERRRWL